MDDARFGSFLNLQRDNGTSWPALEAARKAAGQVRETLRNAIQDANRPVPTDAEVVLFGSLARGEWTSGSDVDWSLLIDGQADPEHRKAASTIEAALLNTEFKGKELIQPGNSGIFGQIVFSHDLVHAVGGEADTNRNTTRRILLLLESIPLADNPGAYARTVRAILSRYLKDDVRIATKSANHHPRLPRFLLNDIVRFWRTMCVDFGTKHWEQDGKKWAIRNIKLRMSRKLLFVSGLLMVFSCFRSAGESPGNVEVTFLDRLVADSQLPPLEIVARELVALGLSADAVKLFNIYDQFIDKLNNPSKRSELNNVDPERAYDDETFLDFRADSQEFEEILRSVFLERDSDLRQFTFKYGVF